VNFLQGVAIVPRSGGHAWAVGNTDSATLVFHWNGTAWH
jgi:hypothetical protein